MDLDRLSTRSAFLIISSKLTRHRPEKHLHEGYYKLICGRDELPEEVAQMAEVLGCGNEVELAISSEVQLLSDKLDSNNRISIYILGYADHALEYKFDNDHRGRRSKRTTSQRMSLNFSHVSVDGSMAAVFEDRRKKLKPKGILDDTHGAFQRLCYFLNQAKLEYFL